MACALGIFYGMIKMSRHDRKDNDGNNHSKSKNTQHKVLVAVLTFAALTAGQSAWADTTHKDGRSHGFVHTETTNK